MGLLNDILKRFFSAKKPGLPGQDNDKFLEDAIHNALLIILTASENAIPLDMNNIETIVAAKEAVKKGSMSTQLESDFWHAYEQAAQSIQPITIDSIKANFDPYPNQNSFLPQMFTRKKIPLSRKCAGNYKLISLITLLLLITIQIYWYIGWSITTDINYQTRTISGLTDKLTDISFQYEDQKGSLNPTINGVLDLEQRKIKQQIKEHSEWVDAASHHLENWNQVWSNMDLLTLQPWQNPDYANFPRAVQRRIQFVAAGNTLEAITGYILPILYGLIGACFYILRQLPKEIEALTFSMNSYIDYSLRMAQGPLAGILISYFFTASQETSQLPKESTISASQIYSLDADLSTLSPLAVAFLAGYSVEFIFRFIDKMLNSSDLGKSQSVEKQNIHPPVKRERSVVVAKTEKIPENPENKNISE